MLLRFDPLREIDRLTEQMVSGTRTARMVPMDVYRRGDSYVVELDLPGVDPSTIDLSIDRNTLTVRAERRPSAREGEEVLVAERPQGAFTRQLALGDGLDTESVMADCINGVLRLTIPVAPAAKPRKVEIKAGSGQQSIGTGAHRTVESSSSPTASGKSESRDKEVAGVR
ncbi:MAG TPA: Hsp20/alpha crystallin family protein [Mycobacteriales bacterium]|nr:Hsp20/alpha crystallin family protein [Mycobacteriales bacterium]